MSLKTHIGPSRATDSRITELSTPLILTAWIQMLRKYPDQDYAQYILHGIEHGFQIGVRESAPFKPAKRNMQSAKENPEIIDDYRANQKNGD